MINPYVTINTADYLGSDSSAHSILFYLFWLIGNDKWAETESKWKNNLLQVVLQEVKWW